MMRVSLKTVATLQWVSLPATGPEKLPLIALAVGGRAALGGIRQHGNGWRPRVRAMATRACEN